MISKLEFKKFKPTHDLACLAQGVLFQLTDFLPAGAFTFAYITKVKNKYQCFLEVKSQKGIFVEGSYALDPMAAVLKVSEKMKDKLVHWRINRMKVNEPTFWGFKVVS